MVIVFEIFISMKTKIIDSIKGFRAGARANTVSGS
jgi:hypothetical protein